MKHTIITLLSDLGTRDSSVAISKAILTGYLPDVTIVDMAHSVKPFDLQQAAYLLLSAYKHFSAGTIHIIAVDIFSGDTVRMIMAEKEGAFFIAPDNGLLSLAFGKEIENCWLCHEFPKPYTFDGWMDNAGKVAASQVKNIHGFSFPACIAREAPKLVQPIVTGNTVECNILFIDRYGNLVLDITERRFNELVGSGPFRIMLRNREDLVRVSRNYTDVPHGEALCRFNDAGFLEIAINHDRATTIFGLDDGGAGDRKPTIRIFFSGT